MAVDDTEVLLYRSKRSDLKSIWQVALILLALAYVLVAVEALALAGAMVASALILMGGARAMEKDGILRKAFGALPGMDHTYPPLDDWGDRLEREGAFSYGEVSDERQ